MIGELRERVDFVVVDAPPLLQVGDPLTMASFMDGIVLVVNPDVARRPALTELGRVVSRSPAAPLGYVVCGGTSGAGAYQYARYGYTRRASAPEAELIS